jgi:PEP-CTERM motif-containing protein
MRVKTKAAGAAVLAFGLIGSSMANATATYTPTFTISTGTNTETFSASTGLQTTDFLAQFNIPQFNSSLGTLTSLTVTVGGSMNALGSVTNSGGSSATGVSLSQNSTITNNPTQSVFNSFGNATIVDGSPNGDTFLLFTTSASAGAGLGTVASSTTISAIPLTSAFSSQTLTQNSGFDPNLLGNGTFGITFATGEYTVTGGSGGNLLNSVATQDNITLSVTYNYSVDSPPSVPEPASLTLIGTGVMGIAAAVRRRRRA